MGVREREREKKGKEKARTKEDKEVSADEEVVVVEEETRSDIAETTQEEQGQYVKKKVESIAHETTMAVEPEVLLPSWGSIEESEWMYHIPPREEDKELWATEWGDYLLEWAQQNNVHQLSLSIFISEPPFSDMNGKVDAFRLIGDELVDKEVAEWKGKNKSLLRVYWRPHEEWADIIYAWAIDTGNTRIDVKTLVIQESDEAFASLPEEELRTILKLIVEKGLAEWVDKKRAAIKIQIV